MAPLTKVGGGGILSFETGTWQFPSLVTTGPCLFLLWEGFQGMEAAGAWKRGKLPKFAQQTHTIQLKVLFTAARACYTLFVCLDGFGDIRYYERALKYVKQGHIGAWIANLLLSFTNSYTEGESAHRCNGFMGKHMPRAKIHERPLSWVWSGRGKLALMKILQSMLACFHESSSLSPELISARKKSYLTKTTFNFALMYSNHITHFQLAEFRRFKTFLLCWPAGATASRNSGFSRMGFCIVRWGSTTQ